MSRSLARYREMRDFGATPEPSGRASSRPTQASARKGIGGIYVVQKHDATRLHYDFRLELDGVLLSWAVPKEPSMSVGVRRLAVRTEDHPVEYAEFRGDIPEGHYGAGHVEIWDRGTWTPVGDADEALRSGHLKFDLDGGRLRGRFVLVRMKSRDGERHENWLLIRERESLVASHAVPRKRPSRAVPRATATATTRATSATEKSGKTGSASSRSVRRRRNGGDHGTER
jgi:bifunctional non-homologous end joining protein LigD